MCFLHATYIDNSLTLLGENNEILHVVKFHVFLIHLDFDFSITCTCTREMVFQNRMVRRMLSKETGSNEVI